MNTSNNGRGYRNNLSGSDSGENFHLGFKPEAAIGESSGDKSSFQSPTRILSESLRWYFRREEVFALIGF